MLRLNRCVNNLPNLKLRFYYVTRPSNYKIPERQINHTTCLEEVMICKVDFKYSKKFIYAYCDLSGDQEGKKRGRKTL